MRYELLLGNKNYSSWSMRAWLLLRLVDVPFEATSVDLYTSESRRIVKTHGGQTGLVPVLKHGSTIIWDTLAITEYLYEDFRIVWPSSRRLRARARSLCGEVHSGMNQLRDAMPVNTRGRNRAATITNGVQEDIQRVLDIWEECLASAGGQWLFGEFCAADIMFAPIATRFQTYGVQLTDAATVYQDEILAHPLVQEWLSLGEQESSIIEEFELPSNA